MKLIKSFNSLTEARQIATQLRSKGILTFIEGENARQTPIIYQGIMSLSVGLWVVLDQQYEDAILAIANPEHQANLVLTENKMRALEAKSKNVVSNFINKTFNIGISFLCISALLIFLGYLFYNVI